MAKNNINVLKLTTLFLILCFGVATQGCEDDSPTSGSKDEASQEEQPTTDVSQEITSTAQLVGSYVCEEYWGSGNSREVTLNIVDDGDGSFSWNSAPHVAWTVPGQFVGGDGGPKHCEGTCSAGSDEISLRDGVVTVRYTPDPCSSHASCLAVKTIQVKPSRTPSGKLEFEGVSSTAPNLLSCVVR
jgi:hypothetical protein